MPRPRIPRRWKFAGCAILVLLPLIWWVDLHTAFRANVSGDRLALLKGATRVETFRVLPDPDAKAANAIGGYPISAVGKEQGREFAARLAAAMLGNGVTQEDTSCRLEPGVAFRLWNGDRAIEVLVCFRCDKFLAYVVGEDAYRSMGGPQDFHGVRADFLELAKEAFPDDKEIQNLPERRI